MRKETTVIYDTKRKAIHFMDSDVPAKIDLWIAIDTQLDLFKNVEKILVAYGVAHNCTSLKEIRTNGVCIDYKVIYNAELKKSHVPAHNLVKYTIHKYHHLKTQFVSDREQLNNVINLKGVVDVVQTRDNNLVILVHSDIFYNITPKVFTADIKRIYNDKDFTFDIIDY